MTEEMTKLEALQNKLCNICDENALTYRFHREGYPIQLVIRPDESPSGQLSMLEVAGQGETGYISQDAAIVFEMDGGVLKHQITGQIEISEALLNKLKILFKKMHYLWLQHFHCEVIRGNLLQINAWPAINYKAENSDDGADDEATEGDTDETDDADIENDEDDGDDEGPDDDTADASDLSEFAQLVDEAEKIVREDGGASISRLQRRLSIGYSKAARLIEALETRGVVGPITGSGMREVLPIAGEG